MSWHLRSFALFFLASLLAALVLPATVALRPAAGCVGRILHVGGVDDAHGRVITEMLRLMINERTGTTVEIHLYPDHQALLAGAAKGEVGILPAMARRLGALADGAGGDGEGLRQSLRQRYGLIWLAPFPGEGENAAVLLVADKVVLDFPALPRLLKKLVDKTPLAAWDDLAARHSAGAAAAAVAREYLDGERLI